MSVCILSSKKMFSDSIKLPDQNMLECQGYGSRVFRSFTMTPPPQLTVANLSLCQLSCHGHEECWPVKCLNTLGCSLIPPLVLLLALLGMPFLLSLSGKNCLYFLFLSDPTTGRNCTPLPHGPTRPLRSKVIEGEDHHLFISEDPAIGTGWDIEKEVSGCVMIEPKI